ncbi:SGNH/GDSL hydrolase family protein [uncultured Cytophaga sp.]|uniref:SGNH/GDSL hydrolase family protein n=1 Tax=uncultured Cytophaga sp. TaxID=160238 RepID=UPI002607D4BA|nr:SGNH/GDSL hydrolase family protein [uncultured Cytophaga sp.]
MRKTLLITILLLVFLSCKMKDDASNITPAVVVVKEPIRYLALGDSYTIGESVPASDNFPAQLADSLNASGKKVSSYKIIARTGWTTTNLIDAIHAASYKDTFNLVSLLIGVNNQYQGKDIETYKIEFVQLAERAIQYAGGKKENVFVVSIPDYGYTPFGKNNQMYISQQIDLFNAANKQLSDSLGLRYCDITPISRRALTEPDLVAEDGLHPSGKMYAEWVDLIMKDN